MFEENSQFRLPKLLREIVFLNWMPLKGIIESWTSFWDPWGTKRADHKTGHFLIEIFVILHKKFPIKLSLQLYFSQMWRCIISCWVMASYNHLAPPNFNWKIRYFQNINLLSTSGSTFINEWQSNFGGLPFHPYFVIYTIQIWWHPYLSLPSCSKFASI